MALFVCLNDKMMQIPLGFELWLQSTEWDFYLNRHVCPDETDLLWLWIIIALVLAGIFGWLGFILYKKNQIITKGK